MEGSTVSDRVAERNRRRIEALIKDGKYYEAHQLTRTLYFRFVSARKYEESNELLYTCALQLLRYSQFKSGCDLSILLVDALRKQYPKFEKAAAEAACAQFESLSDAMQPSKTDGPLVKRFRQSAIEWLETIPLSEDKQWDLRLAVASRLHHCFALACWRKDDYLGSRYHFERTNDGAAYGTMLAQFAATRGYKSECGRFGLQAVLALLQLNKPLTAARCLRAYCEAHPDVGRAPPVRAEPLLNFAWLLLQAVGRARAEADDRSRSLLAVLCAHYKVALEEDADFRDKLDSVGQLYFRLPPRHQESAQSHSLLTDMMQMLSGGSQAPDAFDFGAMLRGVMGDSGSGANQRPSPRDALLD